MSVSTEIKDLVSIIVDGLDTITKWHYHETSNPFKDLQTKVKEEIVNLEEFGFKSNKSNYLFREEMKTMTPFMKEQLDQIKKFKKRTKGPNELDIREFFSQINPHLNQNYYYFVGAIPKEASPSEDSLVKKFLQKSLALIKSLKSLCGKKFEQFFEVLEELFDFVMAELF